MWLRANRTAPSAPPYNRWVSPYLAAWLVALALSFGLSQLVLHLPSRRLGLDWPGERRIHARPVSRLGGCALFGAFTLTLLLVLPREALANQQIQGLLAGSALAFVLGLADDLRPLSAVVKLVGLLAVALVAAGGYAILVRWVNWPLGGQVPFPGPLSLLLSVGWLAGMMNTVNWADGVDGLAAGLALIFSLVLLAIALRFEQRDLALCALALAGSALGFLLLNFYPARLFMGDGGSFFLGYAVGALAILAGAKLATALLVMGVPVLDVVYTIVRRWREGRPIYVADQGHLHHRLLRLGLGQRGTVSLFYVFAAGFGAVALITVPLVKALALILLGLAYVGVIEVVNGRLRAAGRQALEAET